MKHTILVTGHPDASVACQRALSSCEAIIQRGNQINQVFFMHDASYVAVHSSAQQWSAFAAANNTALQTCISTAEQKSIDSRFYAAGFLQGGLSTLADSILSSDVVHQFNEEVENMQLNLSQEAVDDKKEVVFVFQTSPFENSLVAEGIDLLLVLSAFEANLKVIFCGDGIKNISKNEVEKPRYTKRFKALEDFGVEHIFIASDDKQITKYIDDDIPAQRVSLNDLHAMTEFTHTLRF